MAPLAQLSSYGAIARGLSQPPAFCKAVEGYFRVCAAKMRLAVWAVSDRTSRSRILFALPPPGGTVPFWSLIIWLAAQRFGCATSYLGYFIPSQFSFVFPQCCVVPLDCIHTACPQAALYCYVCCASKIISVGVPSSCHDTTHLLGSQKCCELCVFFASSSSDIAIEREPTEALYMVYLGRVLQYLAAVHTCLVKLCFVN